MPRRVEPVEHAVPDRVGYRPGQVERRLLERANRLEHLLRRLERPRVAPRHAAHLLHVEMLGKRRTRRHDEEQEKAAQLVRRLRDEFAVPLHHFGRFAELVDHRPGVIGVHRVHLEQERGDDAEVAAAAANGPEQVGVLLGIGGHEPAVGQHHVHFEDVVDGEAAFAGEMTEPAAQRQPADAGGRDDAGRHGIAERVRRVIDIAPRAAAFDAHGLRDRVDANALHPRQLDHQAVVARCRGRRRCGRRPGWRAASSARARSSRR